MGRMPLSSAAFDHEEPQGQEQLRLRLRQQAALARFGKNAVTCENLDELLTEASSAAAQGLGSQYAKVLELLPAGDSLLVRAGYGWSEGVVGTATVGVDLESPAGFALQTEMPVISCDLSKEVRFRVPRLLRDHNVISAINVIIRGEDRPFGVLEVDSRQPMQFSDDDLNFLQGFANLLASAIGRQRMTTLLQAALREKETLFRELQHRVRNNIQMIHSFIELQSRQEKDEKAKAALFMLKSRVRALALVHNQLDGISAVGSIDLATYIDHLVDNLITFAQIDAGAISIRRSLTSTSASLDIAMPVGLIINEFVLNSLKHAFPNGRGCISITLQRLDSRWVGLTLGDDGVGRDPTLGRTGGVGIQLIDNLVTQIDGEAEWHCEHGTRLIVHIPVPSAPAQ